MADHGYFEELICAELDGELTPAQREELDAHLAACPRCRSFREAMAAVEGAAARNLPDPPAELAANVMAAIRAEAKGKRKKGRIFAFPARSLAVAAAAALVLWAGVRMTDAFRPKGASSAAAPMLSASQVTEEAPREAEPAEAYDSAEAEIQTESAGAAEIPAQAAPEADTGRVSVGNAFLAPLPEGKTAGAAMYLVYDAEGSLLRTASEAELPAGLLTADKPCDLPDREPDYVIVFLPSKGDAAEYRLWEVGGDMILSPPEGGGSRTVSAEVFRSFLEG